MFGLHKSRCNGVTALILAGLFMTAVSGEGLAQESWSLEKEKGRGGAGTPVAQADTEQPVELDVLAKQQLLNLSRAAGYSSKPSDTRELRTKPITAVDLLGGRTSKSSDKTNVAILPAVSAPVTTPVARPSQNPIQPAQFAPNAIATPKAIVPPRAADEVETPAVEPPTRAEPTFQPSPTKPKQQQAPAAIQEVAIAPNIGESPKTAVLRTAPSPDNQLVELVETAADKALALSAGRGQLLNLGKAVSDIFVADPDIADVRVVSPKKIFVHGNKLGRTNIFGIGGNGDIVFGIDLEVVPDATVAQSQLKAVSPDSQANIQLVSDTLVADGEVNSVEEAIQVATLSDQLANTQGPTSNNTVISGSQQVNLRVRFAEVSREDVVNLGVNWSALGNTGDFLIGLSTGPDIGDVAGLAGDLVSGVPGSNDVNVEAFIDALQQEGIISLLAEPNLTAFNGETGNFLAGSEIPILVPGGGGDGTTTIEYKQVGVSLEYIPTILPGNRINLRIRPEVSSPSAAGGVIIDGFQIPAFSVRRTETSVELASGQTMALAGLFQRDITTDVNKFPLLGDLPILGQLFRSERYQRSETELIILITPYLVKPTSNPNIALPNGRTDAVRKPLTKSNGRRAGFILN